MLLFFSFSNTFLKKNCVKLLSKQLLFVPAIALQYCRIQIIQQPNLVMIGCRSYAVSTCKLTWPSIPGSISTVSFARLKSNSSWLTHLLVLAFAIQFIDFLPLTVGQEVKIVEHIKRQHDLWASLLLWCWTDGQYVWCLEKITLECNQAVASKHANFIRFFCNTLHYSL